MVDAVPRGLAANAAVRPKDVSRAGRPRPSARSVAHVFLDAEVRVPSVEVQRRAHPHRRQVRRTVEAGAHLMQRGQSAMRRTWVMPPACTTVVRMKSISCSFDQLLAVPDGVEHFPDRERRDRVAADQSKPSWFSAGVASSSQKSLYGSRSRASRAASIGHQAVMHVVQQLDLAAWSRTQPLEELRHDLQIASASTIPSRAAARPPRARTHLSVAIRRRLLEHRERRTERAPPR